MKTYLRGIAPVLVLLALPLAATAAVTADPEPPAAHALEDANFTSAELDRLLAPVALYPDAVLTQVLAAATYPLEVVEAARWVREHPDVRGDDAVAAVERLNWDPSVKALVAFPDLLARMDADLDWTENLGDAFLASQGEVMDRVQYLRDRADKAGNLDSVEHVRVVREKELIYIEPEVNDVVYVPYYDPWVVYGSWWWPAYPPYRWTWWAGHPASYYAYYGPFYWGLGFRVAPSFYFCAFNWPRHQVVVVNNNYYSHSPHYSGHSPQRYEGSSPWRHAPEHRHGVAYRDPQMNQNWHRGYARSGPDRSSGSAQSWQSREPRREWTANRPAWRDGDTRQGSRDALREASPQRWRDTPRQSPHDMGAQPQRQWQRPAQPQQQREAPPRRDDTVREGNGRWRSSPVESAPTPQQQRGGQRERYAPSQPSRESGRNSARESGREAGPAPDRGASRGNGNSDRPRRGQSRERSGNRQER